MSRGSHEGKYPTLTVNSLPLQIEKAVHKDGLFLFGAGERVRTVDLNLGKVALYQLSYARDICAPFFREGRDFSPSPSTVKENVETACYSATFTGAPGSSGSVCAGDIESSLA